MVASAMHALTSQTFAAHHASSHSCTHHPKNQSERKNVCGNDLFLREKSSK